MIWWQAIFFPFALLFDLITRIRNWMYKKGFRESTRFDANVIAVGNLAIGGTGKTPMIDYLIQYFSSKNLKVSTLSRGYGRETRGFRLADWGDSAATIGDEPYGYFLKYKGKVPVAVGAERDLAISELLLHQPDTTAVLLDDAFQHRRVTPTANIMLTTYQNPFYQDFLLPVGRLRESRKGADRADIIIVTKCPSFLAESDQVRMKTQIAQYSNAKVFFMSIEYLEPKPIFENQIPLHNRVVAISGMAQPQPFEQYISSKYQITLTHHYRDHYKYKTEDIRDITRELSSNVSLITTEKDMVKLRSFQELKEYSCFYIPIRMKFLKDETLFYSTLDSMLNYYAQESN
ncbi:MAG: tetraacyldisaccharide 4'-kinase [Marinoscillum sp.]